MQQGHQGNGSDLTLEVKLPVERFELWFQPVYQIATGRILHNEALLRWRDDSDNLRTPADFLAALDGTGLLEQLDRLVIQKAAVMLAQKSHIRLSVNLSHEVLSDRTLVAYIETCLNQSQVKPKRLSFEIDEMTVAQNFAAALEFCQNLETLGCPIVLDSFTGQELSRYA